jgi:sulfide dehydrogenase cytochrome subunit
MQIAIISLALLLPATAIAAPPGASSCAGCHAVSGPATILPPINGRKAEDIDAAMAGFRDSTRPATLMGRIARGFTQNETHAIAEWLEGQK